MLSTLTTLPASVAATAADWGPGPGRDWDGPPFPLFLVPLFWLVVLAAVVTAVVLGRRHRDRTAGRRSGEQALAERFAAGTIGAEEYRERRAVLQEKPTRP